MVLTQRRRSTDDTILPSASDDYDPKAKPGPPPVPLLDQPLVRAGLGFGFLILFMCGGFLYGITHRAERQGRAAQREQQWQQKTQQRPPVDPSFAPSSRAIVEEEERSQGRPPRLFNQGEFAKAKSAYETDPEKSPLLLSIVGHVFDVTKGEEFYAPGNGYDFFTFRDGSRAFVTGTFTEEGLIDDLTGLSPGECQAVLRWLRFFQDKPEYPYVGRLTGTFFSHGSGDPTPAYYAFRECAYKTVAERDETIACSTRWARDEGTTVWCEDDGLVPRRLVEEEAGTDRGKGKCVCVDPTLAGAHDAGRLVVYPGCDPHADRCTFV